MKLPMSLENGGPPVPERKPYSASLAPAVLVLLTLVGACNRRDRSATATGTAENPSIRTDSTSAALHDTIPAATPDSGLSDANIVALLDEANKADSAAGAYAAPKATTAQVKSFARLMMSEHHALRVQGQQLAQRLNITPEPPTPDPVTTLALSEMAALQGATKMSGFDSTYIGQEIIAHQAVLDLAAKAHSSAQSPELKKLIEQAKPVIQKHLGQAQRIHHQFTKPKT
jgi:putative membrane protein